jgi:hypothetical protein
VSRGALEAVGSLFKLVRALKVSEKVCEGNERMENMSLTTYYPNPLRIK